MSRKGQTLLGGRPWRLLIWGRAGRLVVRGRAQLVGRSSVRGGQLGEGCACAGIALAARRAGDRLTAGRKGRRGGRRLRRVEPEARSERKGGCDGGGPGVGRGGSGRRGGA